MRNNRSFVSDVVFVVVVMVAAMASALLEAAAFVGAFQEIDIASARAGAAPASGSASSVDGTLLSAAAHSARAGR